MWDSFSLKRRGGSDPIISFEAADVLRRQTTSDEVEVFDPGIRFEIVSAYLAVMLQAEKPGGSLKTLLLPSLESNLIWQGMVDARTSSDGSPASVVLGVQPANQDGSAWSALVAQKRDLGCVCHGVNIGLAEPSTSGLRTMVSYLIFSPDRPCLAETQTRTMQEAAGLPHGFDMLHDSDVWLHIPVSRWCLYSLPESSC